MSHHSAPPKIKLDLNKAAQLLRLSLSKAGVAPDIEAQLLIAMDVSNSFKHEHEEGTTSLLIKRLVPAAMVLDPDKKIDVLTFSHGQDNVTHVGFVDENDCDDFVIDKVIGKVEGWNGGTTYSYALEDALEIFGWRECDQHHGHRPGFWTRFFDLAEPVKPHQHKKQRSIVFFVTDGECDPDNSFKDKARTMQTLQDSQDRGDDVYFLFIGACEHQKFEFVQKIAAKYKNTGIVMAPDPEAFVSLSDEDFLDKLLVPELIEWLKA